MNKGYWLSAATSKIRFAPDRAAVYRELSGHLEDKIEANQAKGMAPYDAEQAATAAMGDPRELAEELGRLHAPWWGYLQRATTVALVLVVIAALSALWNILQDGPSWDRYTPTLPEATETWTSSDGQRTRRRLQDWAPEGSVDLGQYRASVPMAYLVQQDPWTSSDGAAHPTSWELTVVLAVSTWKFWEPVFGGQEMVLNHTATDSEGRTYNYDYGDMSPDTDRDLFCRTYEDGPFTTYFKVYFDLPSAVAPRWVEIPFGYGGDVIRVDLAEGRVW